MKKHLKAWTGIVILAYVAAFPVTPADPATVLMTIGMMLVVVGVAYWLGFSNASQAVN